MNALRVVIVEDDPMVIEINRKVIDSCVGYLVVGTVQSGDEGLKMVKELKPELVILDIFMPQVNGIDFLKSMRRKGMEIDVIMVTASKNPGHLKEGMRYGVVDYIIKPFRLERLKSSLDNYRQHLQRIEKKTHISQMDIDLRVVKSDVSEGLPKGMSIYTMNMIKDYLHKKEGVATADEIADGVGLTRVTTRRYLEYLVMQGEMEMNMEYGNIGRPLKKYLYNK